MIAVPRRARHDNDISAHEFYPMCRPAAFRPANAKHRRIAETDRDNGRVDGLLIIINMRAHLRALAVPINQTGLGEDRPIRNLAPKPLKQARKRRPRRACFGMGGLVTISALFIGDPA